MVSHWQSYDESQVAMNLSSSGMGLTAKWCHIGSLIKTVQVAIDWFSSGIGLTVKWCHIGSQVSSDWPSSGI